MTATELNLAVRNPTKKKERIKGAENLFEEIMTENFLNLRKTCKTMLSADKHKFISSFPI